MKLALLGNDEVLLHLAQAAAAGGAHEVACLCEVGDWAGDVLQLFPSATLEGDWETLLLSEGLDVLIVGRPQTLDSSLRIEQLRRLVQEGVPTIVVHPAAEAIVLHELAMIQADTHSPLAAWNPLTQAPDVRQLLDRLADGDSALGELKQVTLQRTLSDSSREKTMQQLACDAGLLDLLAGSLDRITALAPQRDGDSLAGIAVTFAGEQAAVTQWSMQAADDVETGKLVVVGSKERVTLDLKAQGDAEVGRQLLEAIEQFHAASSPTESWNQACHAAELAEAVTESLRRGRTIQLHRHVHSQQQTFKSVMAAGGCLLLLGMLAMLGVSVLVDAIGSPVRSSPLWRMWPLLLLAPVVLFLLLQILWRVFPTKE